jgi:hypothetical protein
MSKFNEAKLNFGYEPLSREQMKNIWGGGHIGEKDCVTETNNGVTITCCNGKKICKRDIGGGVTIVECC